tara:strand:+ start:147 stop:371 length:225 start_codon:yes stop_codon:yes gene_type:complete
LISSRTYPLKRLQQRDLSKHQFWQHHNTESKGTYSLLDFSKDVPTSKGYDVMYNATIDLKFDLKGMVKDFKDKF